MNWLRPTATAVALLALAAGPALAKDRAPKPDAARAQALQSLTQCRAIADDQARLACFDKSAAAFDEAEKSGDIIVVDKSQAREVKRQAFGLNLNSALSIFDRGSHTETVDEVTLTVSQASQNLQGRWVITTQEGQVWRQIDTDPLDHTPKPGETAVVKRGTLGSFFIKVGHDRAMRAHRDE
jgi:hypothetical protein